MNILTNYWSILLICVGLVALGAFAAHLVWKDVSARRVQLTRNMTQQECWQSSARRVQLTRNMTQQECWQSQKTQTAMQGDQGRMFLEMKKEQDEIALFLRNNYQREIDLGYHSGRGLGAIVTGYLALERQYRTGGTGPTGFTGPSGALPSLASREEIHTALSLARSANAAAATERIRAFSGGGGDYPAGHLCQRCQRELAVTSGGICETCQKQALSGGVTGERAEVGGQI